MTQYLDAWLADKRQSWRMVTVAEFLELKKKVIEQKWEFVPNTSAKVKKDPRMVLSSSKAVVWSGEDVSWVDKSDEQPVVPEAQVDDTPVANNVTEDAGEKTIQEMRSVLMAAWIKNVHLYRDETVKKKYLALQPQ